MTVETGGGGIASLNSTYPAGGDSPTEGDNHIRLTKAELQNEFPNFVDSDPVTATQAELNALDGITSTTAELNVLDGITSTVTELNYLDGATAGTALTTGDEGSGNGIDADTVDGVEAVDLFNAAPAFNSDGTQAIASLASWDPPVGIYAMSCDDRIIVSTKVAGAWDTTLVSDWTGSAIITDGSRVRLTNLTGAGVTVRWVKFI